MTDLALLLGICVLGFLVRFLPRVRLRDAITSDTYFHLHCAALIRERRYRIPPRLPSIMLPHAHTYPFGYPFLLALFPERIRPWAERATGALFDTVNTVIVFEAARTLLGRSGLAARPWAPLEAAALFAFAPALLRVGSGPRAYNGSARILGQTLYLLHFLSGFLALGGAGAWAWALCILCGALVVVTSVFGTQVLLFFGIALGLCFHPAWLLLPPACAAAAILLTFGKGYRTLRGQFRHSRFYALHLQKIFLLPGRRTWARVRETFGAARKAGPRALLEAFFRETFPPVLLVSAFPQFLFLPWSGTHSALPDPARRFLLVWALAGLSWFLLTKLRPFLFLGEGERYLEAAMLPSLCLLAAAPLGGWTCLLLVYSALAGPWLVLGYLRTFKALDRGYRDATPLYQALERLPSGPILPVGWVHWEAVQRTRHPVLTIGAQVDPELLPLADFLLVYGNYPYPGADFAGIVRRWSIAYVLADRGCLEQYLATILPDPKVFADATELLSETEGRLLFRIRSALEPGGPSAFRFGERCFRAPVARILEAGWKAVVLCGCGQAAESAFVQLRLAGIEIRCCTDRSVERQGSSFRGVPVRSLAEGVAQGLPCLVATPAHAGAVAGEISATALQLGLPVPAILLPDLRP